MVTPRQLDWASHRAKIRDLYWVQDKELPEVMETMEHAYGFVATRKMYKKYLKAWGLEKNLKTDEAIAMLTIAGKRLAETNKQTLFHRRGRPVNPGKLRRFARRHNLPLDGVSSPSPVEQATPPGVTYTTPTPDASTDFSPPLPRPYPDSATTEVGQAVMEDPTQSSGSGSGGSPHGPDPACEYDVSVPWPPGDSSTGPQRPFHPGGGAGFIADPLSDFRELSLSGGLLRNNMDSPLHFGHWPNPTDGACEGYQDLEGPALWIRFSSPPQHELASLDSDIHSSVQGLSSNYSPSLSHSVPSMSDLFAHNTSPTHSMLAIPDTAAYILDHTALHNAVIAGDVDLARTTLEDGANPNCAARGGMTPLHYAAYQRHTDMVGLLLGYGANLDAMTDDKHSVLYFAVRGRGHLASVATSYLFAYANQNRVGNGAHTDAATLQVIHALYNSPSGWIRLRRGLDKADKDGVTPLMVAAEEGFEGTVRLLLRRGARPDLKDHAGHTALRYAASTGQRKLVRLLLEADPGTLDRDVSHLLKLASKNFTVRAATDSVYGPPLIAEEMVRLCRELGLLGGLLELAGQRGKTNVLQLLYRAIRQLDMESGESLEASVS